MNFLLGQINWTDLETRIGNEKLANILWCLGIVAATLLLKKPLSALVARLSANISNHFSDRKYSGRFRQLLRGPLELLLQTLLFFIAVNRLTAFLSQVVFSRLHGKKLMEVRMIDVADGVFSFLLILFTTLVFSRIADFVFYVLLERAYEDNDKERQQLFPLVKEVIKILVWTIGAFWILGSVFQVNIPALITGLGIGGVAIALAAKETVENFFAAFTILTDKPFQTGDAIKLGSLEGTVERIGFRSTKLRNAEGSVYIVPNKKLVNENLENLTQRESRRIQSMLHLKYGMDAAVLEQMIREIRTMVLDTPHVQSPVAVNLETFAQNAFQLVIQYHFRDLAAGDEQIDTIKQEINLKVYGIVTKYQAQPETHGSGPVAPGKAIENNEVADDPGGGNTLI